MIGFDIFHADAFSAVSLTKAIDKIGYVPGYLGSLPGLVEPAPIRTTDVWIEERSYGPALIQTTPRGAPPAQRGGDTRKARAFKTVRVAQSSRITAAELQNIRSFGSEMDLKTMMEEVARRQFKMKQDAALTKENMLLGMVQGKVYDADGTLISDWYDNFGQTPAAEIGFNLLSATQPEGTILILANQVRRQIARALQGVGGAGVSVHALCADDFWDNFVTNAEVRDTYRFAMAAKELQNQVGGAWESFRYGQITWHNYRGSDDNATVAVPAGKVKFFPTGAGIFQWAMAPAEKFEFVNTLGQESYSWIVLDPLRDAWADPEVLSYPLACCVMPQALATGRQGA
jgi:hypothetical protein